MGEQTNNSPFLSFPERLEMSINDSVQSDRLRRPFIGRKMSVVALTRDVVFGEDAPSLAFGHEHVQFHHPMKDLPDSL